ncbi:MAG: NADH:ubiquinone oxidoreductase [Rhodobacterales bacterium]|nr:MAG: NADH:ubiquinone oxidoreductase [Rhodobacterales bacterium]
MKYISEMGPCGWISWLIGLVAGLLVFWVSLAAVGWLPSLFAGLSVAAFLGLVLSNLMCGRKAEAVADADHAGAGVAAVASGTVAAKSAEEAAAAKAAEEAAAAKAAEEAAAAKAAEEAAAAKAAEEAAAAKAAEEAAAAKAAEEAATSDFDGDLIFEGENEGTRPKALTAPRDGKPDNLKEIKGIGVKLETLCNELGFYHFDQIANWTADELAWVNANLTGFKGRATRDNWIEQAKILAAGGETEFSKRVDEGKVY